MSSCLLCEEEYFLTFFCSQIRVEYLTVRVQRDDTTIMTFLFFFTLNVFITWCPYYIYLYQCF